MIGGYAPRAPTDRVHLRRFPGTSERPLNFTTMRLSFTLVLLLAGCAAQHEAATATRVSVRTADFRLTKSLNPDEVAAFNRLWTDRTEVALPFEQAGGELYIVDISLRYSSRRWHYKSSGYAEKLSIERTSVFRVQDVAAFNRLIGAVE